MDRGLTAITEAREVAVETARALDARSSSPVGAAEAVGAYLADRDALLVLDNCEHVVEASAELTTRLRCA